jgi:hypothetical protein
VKRNAKGKRKLFRVRKEKQMDKPTSPAAEGAGGSADYKSSSSQGVMKVSATATIKGRF